MKIKDKRVYWVWLSLVCGAASRKAVKLVRHFGTAEKVFAAKAEDILKSGAVKEKDRIYHALMKHDINEAQSIVGWCDEKGVDVIVPSDKKYPANCLSLRDAPMVLYVVGSLPEFDKQCCVAVVGTRKMSAYGRSQAFRFGYGLAKGGAVVVSGLALGVDGASMASCIEAGGKTVGVLGCGIDTVYPKEHKDLFRAVIKNGAIVTEYAPGAGPTRDSFPKRNRLISALSLGTVVVEADAFSGALITARHSIFQGKDVFAVPGNVECEGSEGTNQLIKEGAFTVTSPADVLDRYEYVYPHSVSVVNAKRSLREVDSDTASEEVCRKFDVRCEADRYSIYASSLKPLKPREEAEDVELMEGKASDIPKLEPAPKSAKKKRAKAFEDLPDEPVRIDFDMLSDVDKKVYNAMRPHSPMIPDEIKVDGLRIQDVLASLTLLEISGAVEAGSGGYFVRCGSDDISFEDEDAAVPVE
ncbi:MAG: DNA-protecting protein DprA [Ruminococcaceae bacterium]|nr:DNA-protecting protein DprA [Oscillospiraceae bacterium]